jgi:hypothetical protein
VDKYGTLEACHSKKANSSTALIASPSIPQSPLEDWHSYSVPVILHHFSAPTDGPRFYGFLDFLPDLYRETSEVSCLILTTDALAKAYMMNLSDSFPKTAEYVQTYGRALRATNAALADPLERVKDSTIIAVWLLGVHVVCFDLMQMTLISPFSDNASEIIVSSPARYSDGSRSTGVACAFQRDSISAAYQGAAPLRHQKGPKSFLDDVYFCCKHNNTLSCSCSDTVKQAHCLAANEECPPESLNWLKLLRSDLAEPDQLAFTISDYIYHISALCVRIRRHLIHNSLPKEGRDLMIATTILEADVVQNDTYMWTILTSTHPLHIVNTLRAAILKLQHHIILLLDLATSNPEPCLIDIQNRRQKCISITQLVSREVLDSVPYGIRQCTMPRDARMGC